jgi:hypothetical protein
MKIQLETKSGNFFWMCVIYVKYIANLKTWLTFGMMLYKVTTNLWRRTQSGNLVLQVDIYQMDK